MCACVCVRFEGLRVVGRGRQAGRMGERRGGLMIHSAKEWRNEEPKRAAHQAVRNVTMPARTSRDSRELRSAMWKYLPNCD